MEIKTYKVWVSIEEETADDEDGSTTWADIGIPELVGEYDTLEEAQEAADTALFSADD